MPHDWAKLGEVVNTEQSLGGQMGQDFAGLRWFIRAVCREFVRSLLTQLCSYFAVFHIFDSTRTAWRIWHKHILPSTHQRGKSHSLTHPSPPRICGFAAQSTTKI